jgi:outer membrane protein assembly factor BamB
MGPRIQGRTLIADLDKGCIFEVGPDHKELWRVTGFGGPVDMQVLANGNVLAAENHARKVTERDRTGKVVWEKSTGAFAASCQRLPNGNTFIATYYQLLEVAPNGKEAWSVARPEGVVSAQKLRNGSVVLLTSTGKVTILNTAGKEIRSFETGGIISWSSLEVLSNGHVLVCCTPGKVVEFDATGKRVWECEASNPVCATRLSNGHTLICNSEGRRVVEVDRHGKDVWEQHTEGRPWHVRRR